jgi:hypothetical protein
MSAEKLRKMTLSNLKAGSWQNLALLLLRLALAKKVAQHDAPHPCSTKRAPQNIQNVKWDTGQADHEGESDSL